MLFAENLDYNEQNTPMDINYNAGDNESVGSVRSEPRSQGGSQGMTAWPPRSASAVPQQSMSLIVLSLSI